MSIPVYLCCWSLFIILVVFGPFAVQAAGVGKRFFCWIGWHSPPSQWRSTGSDGCSDHAVCPWCEYRGMIDSQGNLF